jgi:hypothetical protein
MSAFRHFHDASPSGEFIQATHLDRLPTGRIANPCGYRFCARRSWTGGKAAVLFDLRTHTEANRKPSVPGRKLTAES